MKLLELSFKNINSLAGEWHVDFTRPEFGDGIFLIVGETGGGKTSVLDAVSLALYGCTARQPSMSKKSNEVMTRGTNECWAEATFACAEGTYTARWEQRRSRRGELQPCTVRLLRGGTDISEHRARDTKQAIERLLGLTFEQFRRTVMLAQGQFDQFLAADRQDRAALLEQATGTGIYAEVGAAIFRRWQQAVRNQDLAEADARAVSTLPEADRTALEEELAAAQTAVADVQSRLQAAETECRWLARGAELEQRGKALAEAEEHLSRRGGELEEARKRLQLARSARALDPRHAELETARRAAEAASAEAARRAKAAAEADRHRTEAAECLRDALEKHKAAAQNLENRLPALEQARELDSLLAAAEDGLSRAEEEFRASQENLDAVGKKKTALEKAISRSQALAGWLGRVLGGEETLPPPASVSGPLTATAADHARQREELRRAEAGLRDALAAEEEAGRKADEAARMLETRGPDLEKAVKSATEAYQLARLVQSMEEHRASLADGDPCPLCGATDHPYCAGQVPRADGTKRTLEALSAERDALQTEASRAAEAHRKASRKSARLRREAEEKRTAHEEGRAHLETARARAEEAVEKDAAALEERTAELAKAQAEAASRGETCRTAAATVGDLRARRSATGVEGSPEEEQSRLQEALERAEAAATEAQKADAAATVAAEHGAAELRKAEESRAVAEGAVSAAAGIFLAACTESGFADESSWNQARWTDGDIRRTEEEEKSFSSERDRLAGARQSLEADLAAHAAEAPSNLRPPEEAGLEREALKDQAAVLQQSIGEKRRSLQIDDERREECVRREAARQTAAAEAARWTKLNGLLGGQDGMQFRKYAQGITLRMLLDRANPHLREMTSGRYEMVWDSASEDLLPQMRDRHQGNGLRPVSNLSGGERFQVSLALALGLSEMSSDRLQVETLFLDEGFGTLDERSLETALDTLERLQEEGRTIGVISHVKELAERFGTQIRVRRTGGTSVLEGAGVSRGGAV